MIFRLRKYCNPPDRSALLREGSVGAQFRSDFPNKGKDWRKRTVIVK